MNFCYPAIYQLSPAVFSAFGISDQATSCFVDLPYFMSIVFAPDLTENDVIFLNIFPFYRLQSMHLAGFNKGQHGVAPVTGRYCSSIKELFCFFMYHISTCDQQKCKDNGSYQNEHTAISGG